MVFPSIVALPELIDVLPGEIRAIADRLLFVERVRGTPVPPPAMHAWIMSRFGGLEQVCEQTIVKVTNLMTLEAAFFNPLRARRPQENDGQSHDTANVDQSLEAAIAASAGAHDIFHDPFNGTTADVFGRIRGKYCTSASNIAKCDGWHGLVIFDEFHPLRFSRAQLRDYFDVALRWLDTAHRIDPEACYPLIIWNCLWKSGASITHGHMQMLLSRGMACGQVERWRRAAVEYRTRYGANLSADLSLLHAALDLALHATHDVSGYATLTPVKEREVLLTSSTIPRTGNGSVRNGAELRTALGPLWDATFAALRALIDDQGVRCFNVAVYLPPFGPTTEPWDDLPVCVRIVDRGDPMSRVVNFGAMEMFASSVITSDPFAVATALRLSPIVHM